MINIEVSREANESTSSALRRFSKKVSGSGIIKRVKGLKSRTRTQSHYKRKKSTLTRLARTADYERLKKLGKIQNAFGRAN